MTEAVARPAITMPKVETAAVNAAYRSADVILEYGSGGSTVMAAELGKRVFSVESDAEWCASMENWFLQNPGGGQVSMHHGNIGPTGKWGMPVGPKSFRNFPDYALSVWDRPDFVQPDVVLIDGRFRPACLLATAFRTQKPVRVLFDDYTERDAYHGVEEMFKPFDTFGRMADFLITPTPFPVDRMAWVMSWFLKPQ